MKIAIVSESPADEAAIKILVDAIVGSESDVFTLRTRPYGWTKIFELLPNIIAGLHQGTYVDALVVVVDSDDSPVHQKAHESANADNPDCRLCRLRSTVRRALSTVRPLHGRASLKSALGLAVPAIEAWYLCGVNPHVNEATWNRGLSGERISYDRRSLKVEVYGSLQPSLATETEAAIAAAERLTNRLELLERLFPDGFGCLLLDIRNWSE